MNILITGASGFIGSFLVEEALRRGFDTWAGVRATSSRRYLADPRTHFLTLDFDDPEQLRQALAQRRFDYVVHAAGATKCTGPDGFRRANTRATQHLVEALLQTRQPLRRFVYMSSLSVMGAPAEAMPHRDICASDTPAPNTAYGRSKLEAEQWLHTVAGQLPHVILRPTGVYGPREKDYYTMAQSIKQHVDFSAGFSPQDLTFIYVRDLVEAVFLALDRGQQGAAYALTDGRVYSATEFNDLLWQEMGRPWRLKLTAPLWLLRALCAAGELRGRLTGKPVVLNRDKYAILSQRNWRCDIAPARHDLGFQPQWDLARGVKEAVAWYKEAGWL